MWRPAKADKDFAKTRGFKDINFPVKIRDIHKIENKNSISISIFVYKNKEKYPEKKCWLIINWRRRKNTVLVNEFNRFMYDHSLHLERKQFCPYWLHAFITGEILKLHIKDCFKVNVKQTIKTPNKGEYVKFKNFKRKIKPPFMIYVDLENILVPEDNGKQNPNKFHTTKYQKHVDCSYGY